MHSVVYPTTGRPRRWPKTNPRGVIAIISGLELSGIPLQDVSSTFLYVLLILITAGTHY